jgi:hypothetical protein
MSLRIVVQALPQAVLVGRSTPLFSAQGETIPWVFYDTINYPAAGTVSNLNYFQTVQSDKTLGNLDQGGQLPAGFFHQINSFQFDPLSVPAIAAAGAAGTTLAGPAQDLAILFSTARALFQFTISSKLYVQVPLTYLHASGYPVAVLAGAFTAATQAQFVGNSFPDGDYYIGNNIIIPPQQAFLASIIFAGAPNAINVATLLRIGMPGALTRRVL